MQPLSGNQHQDLPWKCYKTLTFCSPLAGGRIPCACHTKRRFNVQKLYILTWTCASRHNGVHFLNITTAKVLWTWCALQILTSKCASRHNGVTFSTSQLPKVLGMWCALDILTSKCASRHNGMHFLSIATSKGVQNVVRFVHFDFQACIFSTSQLPKVLRTWGAFSFFTSKCASCHSGVQLFISHPARWLRTRCFSEPTFQTSGATSHGKNTVNRDFSTFSRACIFFLLTLSLLWSSFFFSSLLWLFPPLLFYHQSHILYRYLYMVNM